MKKLILIICIVLGSISTLGQTINISPTHIDSMIALLGTTSPVRSSVVQGTNLTSNLIIQPNPEFEVSLSNSPFVPAYPNLTPVAGVVPPTTIYIRFVGYSFYPNAVSYDQLPVSSTGAITRNLNVSGMVKAFEPTIPSTLSFGGITNNSIDVNINGGNGTLQLLLAKESSPVDVQPQDIYSYIPGSFGTGSQLGNGNFVVKNYNFPLGPVTGLSPGKTYYFAVYDYHIGYAPQAPMAELVGGSENYLLSGAGTGSATTSFGYPLPILINYINGTKQGHKHLLNWKVTCISTPRVTMVLERSADSRNFTDINSITADAVRCNQPFDYTDTDPLKGMNYYRLKMTDADGKVSYSSIVALLNAVKGFDIVSIAPNPVVDDNFKLNVASARTGKMDIAIFDDQGRLVNRQSSSVIAGFNSLPIQVGNLSSGSYTIRGSMGDEKPRILRFIKQ